MDKKSISKESYDRLSKVLGKPDEYFEGKICNYYLWSQLDGLFLFHLDKDFVSDYFLIKDWVNVSFYRPSTYTDTVLKKMFKDQIYTKIPLENIKLMWNAFNENKKEKEGKDKKEYHEIRYFYIPDFASFLVKKSRAYNPSEVLSLLKEMVTNLKEEMEGYYIARNCAKLLGDYCVNNREINEEIFQYLKEQQNLDDKQINIGLIFYDWQLSQIHDYQKVEKLINLMKELKPSITHEDMIKESINRKAFHIIKYIHHSYEYIFSDKEIESIMEMEKNSYGQENISYIIENFQPVELVKKHFDYIYSDYNYLKEPKNNEFYLKNKEYLTKKI